MLKQILITIFCLAVISVNGQKFWTSADISTFRTATQDDIIVMPKSFQSYTLEIDALSNDLYEAPVEQYLRDGKEGKIISLPNANGEFETFEVFYSPMMAPGLASRYPSIRSYKGVSTQKRSRNIRLDVGPYGFHAAIHSPDKVEYIDPYSRISRSEYVVYDVKDQPVDADSPALKCGVDDHLKNTFFDDVIETRSTQGILPLREYDFALACTGQWGAIRGSKESALADMVTGMNRMNQILENESAIRMILIEDNDKLIYLDPDTDPYNTDGNSGGLILGQNNNILNSVVGFASFDIGHVYHTSCSDVGGIAFLGAMCTIGTKGGGVTCHYNSNLDYIAANVTAHEVGHQMGAQHTFNNCDEENESLGNGYEPGSGSTIMSYAGGCGSAKNVVNQGDDYYHVASLIQIYNHTRDGGTADACANLIETTNEEPVISIDYQDLFAIPESTFFFLEGSATDANDDDLTYSWEGFNVGPLSPLGSPIGSAPRFRSFPPSESAIRYFPSTDNVLNLQFDRTEVMPVGDMLLNFMFTVRDNNPQAGASVWEEIRLRTIDTPGRFEVTSQNSGTITAEVGDELEVTWNVADTDIAPINAELVDILLNTENAAGFDIHNMEVLASRVPNNGSAKVYLPNVITTKGRIIVKASESVFFSINKRNIIIEEPTSPKVFVGSNPSSINACLPTVSNVDLSVEGLGGLEGDIQLAVTGGLPDDVEINFSSNTAQAGDNVQMDISYPDGMEAGKYEMEVQAMVEGVDTFTRVIAIYVTDSDHSAIDALGPENGEADVTVAPTFNWVPSENADSYTIEVATSPTFGSAIVFAESGLTDSFFVSPTLLEKKTLYYWRIIPKNSCEEGTPIVFAFSTEVLACAEFSPSEDDLPLNISQSGTPTEEVIIPVTGGNIADVNILRFIGEHDNNKDMEVSLIAPSGTSARLFSKICEQPNFNCTFDDASNVPVKCPLNANGASYRPKDAFSIFNGEAAAGNWILRIEDTKTGNGGRLNGLLLEVCASQSVESPFMVRNEKILLPWGGDRTISEGLLKADDNNNSSDELIFTLVELPSKGELMFNGSSVNVGDQFSQKDINDDKLNYVAAFENYNTHFSFTVVDDEGGAIGITEFEIEVDELNSIEDLAIRNNVVVYPVPASEQVTIDLTNSEVVFDTYEIIDINGQIVSRKNIKGAQMINVELNLFSSSVYIINLKNESLTVPKKLIIK